MPATPPRVTPDPAAPTRCAMCQQRYVDPADVADGGTICTFCFDREDGSVQAILDATPGDAEPTRTPAPTYPEGISQIGYDRKDRDLQEKIRRAEAAAGRRAQDVLYSVTDAVAEHGIDALRDLRRQVVALRAERDALWASRRIAILRNEGSN